MRNYFCPCCGHWMENHPEEADGKAIALIPCAECWMDGHPASAAFFAVDPDQRVVQLRPNPLHEEVLS